MVKVKLTPLRPLFFALCPTLPEVYWVGARAELNAIINKNIQLLDSPIPENFVNKLLY